MQINSPGGFVGSVTGGAVASVVAGLGWVDLGVPAVGGLPLSVKEKNRLLVPCMKSLNTI